jgi:hypothetical protein
VSLAKYIYVADAKYIQKSVSKTELYITRERERERERESTVGCLKEGDGGGKLPFSRSCGEDRVT